MTYPITAVRELFARRGIDWRRVALAAVLGVVAFIAVLLTLPEYGLTWDEPLYLAAGERHGQWLRGVWCGEIAPSDRTALRAAWHDAMTYHPSLSRLLSVATLELTGDLLGPLAGQRIRSALLLALTVATAAWWLARRHSLLAGLAGGWAVLCQPRLFGDAHLATTDMPLACFWLLTVLAFHYEWERQRRPWLTGAGLALLLLTKHAGILILLGFFPLLAAQPRRGARFLAHALALALCCYPLLQPQVWAAPREALDGVVRFFLLRQEAFPTPTWFFGELYPTRAGWHYGLTMLLLVTPVPLLAAMLAGAARLAASRTREARYLLLQVLLLPAVMALPPVPTYDGVRLMLPALPLCGLLAGPGLAWLLHLLPRGRWLLLAAWLFAAALPLWQYAPRYYLSYYNELIGGLPGAAAAGMETTYYGEAFGPRELAWLNRTLPPGARVHFGGISPWVMTYYREHGLLRRDLRLDNEHVPLATARARGAEFLLLNYRWSYIHAVARKAGGAVLPPPSATPVYRVALQEVPLLAVYDLRNDAGNRRH